MCVRSRQVFDRWPNVVVQFEDSETPKRVDAPAPLHSLVCSHFHSLAISQAGQVYSWGRGSLGLLGLGDEKDGAPRPIDGLRSVKHVACGPYQSAAVTAEGDLFIFGWAAMPSWSGRKSR